MLLVHNKHTKAYAHKLGGKKDLYLEVNQPPRDILKQTDNKVIGIGGGSVIDTAKILANPKKCIAIPTTFSGASQTQWAVIWGKKKLTIKTPKPILQRYKDKIKLSKSVFQSTLFDCFSHAIESLWSKNATKESKGYSIQALNLLNKKRYIEAGIAGGNAITIAKTNIIHAISYPITLKYKIPHGTAIAMILPSVIKYLEYDIKISDYVKYTSPLPKIKIDAKFIAKEALKYKKIYDCPKKITSQEIEMILVE